MSSCGSNVATVMCQEYQLVAPIAAGMCVMTVGGWNVVCMCNVYMQIISLHTIVA